MKSHTSVHSSVVSFGPQSGEGPGGKGSLASTEQVFNGTVGPLLSFAPSHRQIAYGAARHKINVFINRATSDRYQNVEVNTWSLCHLFVARTSW